MQPLHSNIILLLLFIFQVTLSGQCPEGILHVVSDEEIAAFAKQYPNCTELDSSLIIGPNSYMAETRISNIEGLKNIRVVNGDLTLAKNPWLKDISVLNGIEKVTGNVHLRGLTIGKGLDNSNLVVIGGDLKYSVGINMPTKQYRFPELVKIGGNLEAYLFKDLKIRFPELWHVGGNIRLENWELIQLNNEFPSLERVEGSLNLKISTEDDVKAFRKLKYAKSIRLEISYAPKQVFFGDLDSCESVFLNVKPNTKILGLHKLEYLDYLRIEKGSPSILKAFHNLKEAKYVEVEKSDKELRGVFGFPVLERVEELKLYTEGLTAILKPNMSVNKLRLRALSTSDKKYLNTEQLTVNRLIFFQTDFINLPDLKGLAYKELEISGNRKLSSLNGFSYKKNPLKYLQIESCAALANLNGLDVDLAEDAKIRISSNRMLKSCDAPWLCAAFKNTLDIVMQSNKACDKQEVKVACGVEE